MNPKRTRRRWTYFLSAFVVVALTGCGMYPSGPGKWPGNFWGTVLHTVSDVIDFFAHHVLGGSYGLAILVVTIIVRLIIMPLFIRQLRYQKFMAELQPEVQKIRAKHKGDNQKIQQETMKLYQEKGMNPAAGCLPTVIQLPVLYALYGALMGNIGIHDTGFLWMHSLGQRDPYYILPVVAGITTFLSSWIMMKNQPKQQRMILFIMPLFIIFIGARLPAGLVLYWVYTNLFTALQSWFFKSRMAQPAAAGATVTTSAKTKATSGGGQRKVEGKAQKAVKPADTKSKK